LELLLILLRKLSNVTLVKVKIEWQDPRPHYDITVPLPPHPMPVFLSDLDPQDLATNIASQMPGLRYVSVQLYRHGEKLWRIWRDVDDAPLILQTYPTSSAWGMMDFRLA